MIRAGELFLIHQLTQEMPHYVKNNYFDIDTQLAEGDLNIRLNIKTKETQLNLNCFIELQFKLVSF